MESIWTTGNVCKSSFDARVIAILSICGTKCCRWGSRAYQHRETCGKRGGKKRKLNSNADICKNAADHELFHSCGWEAKTADIGTSTGQIPLFVTIMFRNSIQDGTKFTVYVEDSIGWGSGECKNSEYVSLINSKLYWNCTAWKFIRRYRCPIIRGAWIRNSDEKNLTPEMRENWNRRVVTSRRGLGGVERGQGECYQWKQKDRVREETNIVSGMRVTIVQNRHQKPRHTLSHNLQKNKAEVCREKELPDSVASLRSSMDRRGSMDRRVNKSWKVLAPHSLVSVGILPNVNSINWIGM